MVTYWTNTEPPWDTDVPWIVRFAVRWAITMVGFLAAAWIVRGVDVGGWESLLPAAAIFGGVRGALRPSARPPAGPVPAPPGVAAAVREPGTGASRRACFEFRGEGLGGDPVHVVAAAAAVLHLDTDLVPGTGLLHAGAVYLHAVHQLLKVGGVALDADRVADPKLGRQVYSRHAYL